MSNQTTQVPDDQLSPKDVILKIIEIKNILVKNWKSIVFLTFLGAGIGYLLDFLLKKPDEFEAEIIFNLGAGSASSAGGFGDLAGLMGLGGTPDANIFTGENFFYFVKSRPVLERTFMKEIEINGKKDILANMYIDSSGIKKMEWEDREMLHDFKFKTNDVEKMDRESRVILNELVDKVRNDTEISELDRKSSFVKLSSNMETENLSVLWLHNLLATVEEVYTENQTKKSRKTLSLLQNRADSIAAILSNTEARLAQAVYTSSQVLVPEAKVPAVRLQRNSTFLQQLYFEAVASVEKMKVSLVREAPLFTKIEDVKVPLDMKPRDNTRLKLGIIIGFLISLIYVYFKTIFQTEPAEVIKA